LPIALGMLVATGQLLPEHFAGWATIGELALEGTVRTIIVETRVMPARNEED